MKYEVINELTNFDYHDAYVNKIDFQNRQMIWEVENINATTKNSQNNFDEDMCVENAVMIFENAHIESIVFGAYKIYDSNNILIESKEAETASSEEYDEILKSEIKEYCSYIYAMELFEILDNEQYKACFSIANMYLTIIFSKSIIKWDNFCGKAWYEDEKFKKQTKENQ
jgi:hypothetical protein